VSKLETFQYSSRPDLSKAPELRTTPKSILVVDDNKDVQKSISKFLFSNGYLVLTASSAKEALQRSRDLRRKIDVLLSAFNLPEMHGRELATRITLQCPQIKVLLMKVSLEGIAMWTPVLDEEWHFLQKPFIAEQLRALLVSLISPAIPNPDEAQ